MTETWGEDQQGRSDVPVKVNGEGVGFASPSETLGAVASEYANNHGLKTYSVIVNGQKADTSTAGRTLAALGATSVELVAKEARG